MGYENAVIKGEQTANISSLPGVNQACMHFIEVFTGAVTYQHNHQHPDTGLSANRAMFTGGSGRCSASRVCLGRAVLVLEKLLGRS